MRRVVLAAALVGAIGCGKRINPAWCQQPENQSASDCPATIEDAAVVETSCHANSDCAGDPVDKLCLTATGEDVCVQCLSMADCEAASPVCSDAHACLPCEHDFECGTDGNQYCQDGRCLVSTSALYAAPDGTGTTCLQTAPCSLAQGVALATQDGKVLRLVPSGANYTFSVGAVISLAANIRISGPSDPDPNKRVTLDGGGLSGPMIKISGGTVELDFLNLTGVQGTALQCSTGTFTARRLYLHDLQARGTDAALTAATACSLLLDGVVIDGNPHGAVDVSGSAETPFEIRNSVFANNAGGPAVTLRGNGHFEYNTVVGNRAHDTTSGVSCVDTTAVLLDMNILANNTLEVGPTKNGKPTPVPQLDGCRTDHGYSHDVVDLRLAGSSDPFLTYSLTPFTPLDVVNVSNVSCAGLTDIDQAARPAHARCDMGADECSNCVLFDFRNDGDNEQDLSGNNSGH